VQLDTVRDMEWELVFEGSPEEVQAWMENNQEVWRGESFTVFVGSYPLTQVSAEDYFKQ